MTRCSPKDCKVFLCNNNGSSRDGTVTRKSNLPFFFAAAGLPGRFGFFFRGKDTEDSNIIRSLEGHGDIRASGPDSGTPLIAIRKGESKQFDWYQVFFPADMPVEEAKIRIHAMASNPDRHFDRLEFVAEESSASLEEAGAASDSQGTEAPLSLVRDIGTDDSVADLSETVAETPVVESADAPESADQDDPFPEMSGVEIFVVAGAFSKRIFELELGMTELLEALLVARRRLEMRFSSMGESEALSLAKKIAIDKFQVLLDECDHYFLRLLPAAKKIQNCLEKLPPTAK